MTHIPEGALADQMARVGRARAARAARYVLRDERITLSHGAGGKASRQLLEGLLVPLLGAGTLQHLEDSAVLTTARAAGSRLAFTTDSYVVSPLFFPGGDIGMLAVNGTINDLATAGATPIALSLGLILEEGLAIDVLRRVVESVRDAAADAGVAVVTGDTKVVQRGKADGIFINTAGIGMVPEGVHLSAERVRPGDRVLLSGRIGDHGIAVMLAREPLEIESDVRTDSAALHRLAAALMSAAPATRCLKDPTRGGVATALNEIAQHAQLAIRLDETCVPVSPEVRGACEILGLDPLHIANEGRMIAIVPPEQLDAALQAMRGHPAGRDTVVVGEVLDGPAEMVMLRTEAGGLRVLDMLTGDPLPRIC